jgi:predicted nucleotidyltransferase
MKPYQAPEIQEKLKKITKAILSVAPDTESIYLFGSYVNGTPHKDSDLDFFIVVPNSDAGEIQIQREIALAIFYSTMNEYMSCDLLVNNSEDFRHNLNFHTFDQIAATTGVKIYG